MGRQSHAWLVAAAGLVAVTALAAGGRQAVAGASAAPAPSSTPSTTTRGVASGGAHAGASDLEVTSSGATVGRSLKERFADVTNAFDFIPARLHAGIRAHTNGEDLTAYLQAAIDAAGSGTLFLPSGTYQHRGLATHASITIRGAGWQATVLKNVSAATPSLMIGSQPRANYLVGGVAVSDLRISGPSKGAAVLYDTQSHTVLSRVHILDVGGHGVQIGGAQHVYGLTISQCIIQNAEGDGVFGKGSWGRQVNAINILDGTEIITSGGNGINLWGTSVNVRNSIIEGNRGYGVLITEADAIGEHDNRASSFSIEGSYFEGNKRGNIRVEVGRYGGRITKAIDGLTIRDNYLNGGGMDRAARNVSMSVTSGGMIPLEHALLEGLTFTGNAVAEDYKSPALTGVCDFGDAPGSNSVVTPGEAVRSAGGAGAKTLETRYLNLGDARLNGGPRSLVIPGFIFAKGDFAFDDPEAARSREVALDPQKPRRSYFPIQLPRGSVVLDASIYADTTSVDYSVEVVLLARDPRNAMDGWRTLMSWTSAHRFGPGLVRSTREAKHRIESGDEELLLRVSVTGAKGTGLRLGNPILHFN